MTGVIGGAAAWLGSAFKKANSVLNAIQKAEQTLQEKLAQGTINDKELEAEQAVAIATQRVEEHEQQIGILRREIDDFQPSRRLHGFPRQPGRKFRLPQAPRAARDHT